MRDFDWHVFISHASEDKATIARQLADHFVRAGLRVWLDEAEIKVGQSIRTKIDEGLRKSAYGVVILSPAFLRKKWTRDEIDGLLSMETVDQRRILPVWHNVEFKDVSEFSPMLAGRLAANTNEGSLTVFNKLYDAMDDAIATAKEDGWPWHSGRITKKLLMTIPEGYFVLSNLYNANFEPRFAEVLGPLPEREALWERFKELGITKTKFYVFETMKGYRRYVESQRSMYY